MRQLEKLLGEIEERAAHFNTLAGEPEAGDCVAHADKATATTYEGVLAKLEPIVAALASHVGDEAPEREPTENEWCCDSCGLIAPIDTEGWEETPGDDAGVSVERCPSCRLEPPPPAVGDDGGDSQ